MQKLSNNRTSLTLTFARSVLVTVILVLLIGGCTKKDNIKELTGVSDKHIEHQQKEPDTRSEVIRTISKEEKKTGIKPGLLRSIAMVESHCTPYVVNVRGKTFRFKTKHDAAAFVSRMARAKKTNLSVGCLQLHYKSHKKNFASDEDMLSIKNNVSYAAKHLKALYDKYGDWNKAVKMYHSSNARRGNAYYRRVMRVGGV